MTDENIFKLSHLLYDSENNEREIYISKLDEDLYSDDKKYKDKKYEFSDSNFEAMINNITEKEKKENSKQIFKGTMEFKKNIGENINNNISSITTTNNTNSTINNDNNIKNDFENNKINIVVNKDKTKIIQNNLKDEVFISKNKTCNCICKIPFYLKMILLFILFAIGILLLFFIINIIVKNNLF